MGGAARNSRLRALEQNRQHAHAGAPSCETPARHARGEGVAFFGKWFGRAPAPPSWAALFDAQEYAVFASELQQALAARSLPSGAAELRAGAVPLKRGSESGSLGF